VKKRLFYILGILVILSGLMGPIIYSDKLARRQRPLNPVPALSGSTENGSALRDDAGSGTERDLKKNTGSGAEKGSVKNANSPGTEKERVTGTSLPGILPAGQSPGGQPPENATGVHLWVTQDFGRSSMYAETVGFRPGDAALDILNNNLNIETAHGGTFVNSINGVASGYTGKSGGERRKKDWFYWVNGVMASVGADQFVPGTGDVIWWDYHDWSTTMFVPAVIGAYPEPFLHGYNRQNRGAVILYADGYEQQAQKIKRGLEKLHVEPVSAAPFSEEGITKRTGPAIVVGPWTDLKQSEILRGINERGVKNGLYVKFSDDGFDLLTSSGQTAGTCGKDCGAIVAVGTGSGKGDVLWLVTGVDRQGLENAVAVLSERPLEIKYCFGAAIDSGKVIPLPVQ